ncbi:MAG: class II aldolase/adducin family protein [Clostridia bacterium]|nr:class II aldolase/adducin family protein [Clostridia bacterium]
MNNKINPELKIEVAKASHLFWEKGLTTGNDGGDVSLRDPETGYIYICPSATARHVIPNWGIISPTDIVVTDIAGNPMEENWMKQTVEAKMHYDIYKARPEVNAIVHSHALYSTVFAAAAQNIPPCTVEASFLGGEVICAGYGRIGSQLLADNIVNALGQKKKAALLQNHGAVLVGKTFREAFCASDYLEKLAHVAILVRSMGAEPVLVDVSDLRDPDLV